MTDRSSGGVRSSGAGFAEGFLLVVALGAIEAALAVRTLEVAAGASHARMLAVALAAHIGFGALVGAAAAVACRVARQAESATAFSVAFGLGAVVAVRTGLQSEGLAGLLAGLLASGLAAWVALRVLRARAASPARSIVGWVVGLALALGLWSVARVLPEGNARPALFGAAVVALALGATRFAVLSPFLALGAAVFGGVDVPALSKADGPARPSLLLVTIDTLRADRVGAYGDKTARTPTFDGLASRGVRFDQAIVHSTLTGPSHMSILSGVLPTRHQVTLNVHKLSDEVPTLPELLSREGYQTAAFVSGFPLTERASGLLHRFDYADDDLSRNRWLPEQLKKRVTLFRLLSRGEHGREFRRGAEITTELALEWLGKNRGPFFLWVHYYDPHVPYDPPVRLVPTGTPSGPSAFQWYGFTPSQRLAFIRSQDAVSRAKALYGAQITRVDEQLDRLVRAAEAAAGELTIVVTADHGESMGDHELWWGRDLHDPTVRVPLVVVPPKTLVRTATVVRAQVRSVDLAPTILELSQLTPPANLDGVSLVPWLTAARQGEAGPAISIQRQEPPELGYGSSDAVRSEHRKLIRLWAKVAHDRRSPESFEVFDLAADPGELINLAETATAALARLTPLLPVAPETQADRSLSSDDEAALRSLGYLQ
ncbi:MAG: sulfatase [Deltaproteobacteria bacterium]|nr:sulfatase [Deltaproteobacteria bacterium]